MPETCWAGPRPSYPQLLLRQVTAVVDATVHGHKALEGRPVSTLGLWRLVLSMMMEKDRTQVSAGCDSGQSPGPGHAPSSALTPQGRRVGCLNALKVHPVLPVWHSSPSLTSHSSGAPCCKQAQTVSCLSPCVPHTRHFCSCWAPA